MDGGQARRTGGDRVRDIAAFSRRCWPDRPLRGYQVGPAQAIVDSVLGGGGATFCLIFSRQSGKDELVAQVTAFLLHHYQERGGTIVLAAPTLNPQAGNSRDRLVARLTGGAGLGEPRTRAGRLVQVGVAEALFFSAAKRAQARGATASLLLLCNEAQHVDADHWDAVFDPMAASTNATTVFFGTPWQRGSLLARQTRYCAEMEAGDGRRRVFRVPWELVAAEMPAYGDRVRARIAQLGEQHPFIRSEYCLEELDGAGGLFGPDRQAHLVGDHPRQRRPTPGRQYALLIDVAGAEETAAEATPGGDDWGTHRRDATALTVVEVDHRTLADPLLGRPTYRVVDRTQWVGAKHTSLYGTLRDLAENVWRARWVVIDATGVGAGLAGFLAQALGSRCRPVIFTSKSKSDIGWSYLAAIDAGRVKEYRDDGAGDTRRFWQQLGACTYEVAPGPGRSLRWSVPSATLHDDLLVSAALIGWLDLAIDWRTRVAHGRPSGA
ncbi:MAG: hypothetical protein IT340_23495 [Chloroflexi bacterium]|nr:hypothetical protein [Chloroflexota bacterium]